MRRRSFLKSGLVFTGLIWIPKASAQLNIGNPFFVGGVLKPAEAAGGCSTLQQSIGGTFDDFLDFTFYTWHAVSFAVGGSGYTCCKVEAFLVKLGTPAAGTITAKIYTDSAGSPGTLVGSGSSTVDRTTVPASETYISFPDMNAALSASTTYWRILQASSVDTNGSNAILDIIDNTGETGVRKASTDGTSWDFNASNTSYGAKFYSA